MNKTLVKELSLQEMQSIDGGWWHVVVGFIADLVTEYIYDPAQAKADFKKGYNSTR